MGIMHVLGKSGDSETRWDPADPQSVKQARERFEEYRRRGLLAFVASEAGAEAVHVRDFHPEAGEIVFTRPLIGG